jgi:hypothetical protein
LCVPDLPIARAQNKARFHPHVRDDLIDALRFDRFDPMLDVLCQRPRKPGISIERALHTGDGVADRAFSGPRGRRPGITERLTHASRHDQTTENSDAPGFAKEHPDDR